MRRRSISKYTQCPPHGVDRRYSLRSSSALWMSGLHAELLAVSQRHATGRSRRQCRESSLMVDPLLLPVTAQDILPRDHGIRRVRRGCRPSATKPGGERQAFRRVSGYRISKFEIHRTDAMEVCRSSAMRPRTGFCRPSTKAGVGGTRWKCAMSISGPELVFVHTQTHPDTRGAYPQAHPRPPTHISPGGRGLCVQKIRY